MMTHPFWTAPLTLAAGLGLSRNPGDYAPLFLLICMVALLYFGYRRLSRL